MKKKVLIVSLFVVLLLLVLFIYNSNKTITLKNSYKKLTSNIQPNTEKKIKLSLNKKSDIVIDNIKSSNINNHSFYLLEDEKGKIVSSGLLKDSSTLYNVDEGNYLLKIISDGKNSINFDIKRSDIVTIEYAILEDGEIVRDKIFDYELEYNNPNIKSIKLAKQMDEKYRDSNHLVSSSKSKSDIYMWGEGDVLYFYSDVTIAFAENSSFIFSTLIDLIDISDLRYFDFSNVKDASYMFSNDYNLSNIDAIASFDTKNVIDVENIFGSCYSLEDITPFIRFANAPLRNMSSLFSKTKIDNIYLLKYFDISRVNKLDYMFEGTNISDLTPLKDWNTKSVISMSSMFSKTKISNIDPLKDWDVSNVRSMSWLFEGCMNLDNIEALKNWDTKSLYSFDEALKFTNVDNLDVLKNFKTDNLISFKGAFSETRNLKDISGIKDWNVKNIYDFSELFDKSSIEDISPIENWDVSSAEDFRSMFSHTKIKNLDSLKNWKVSNVKDFSEMFNNTKITNLSALKNWDIKSGEKFNSMFANNSNLKDNSGIDGWTIQDKDKILFESPKPTYNTLFD